jgi:hypothetical protein
MIPRRGLLAGLGALLAAPAIIRTPGLLMPVKAVVLTPSPQEVFNYWAGKRVLLVSANGITHVGGKGRVMERYAAMAEAHGATVERRVAEGGYVGQRADAAWFDEASEFCNDELLRMSEHCRNGDTVETQRRLIFGNWSVGNSEVS